MSETTPTPPPPKPAAVPVAAKPAAPQPLTFTHATMPDWGVGLVVQDLPLHWVLFFEKAGEKKFVKAMALEKNILVATKLTEVQLAALQARASGRKPRAAQKPTSSLLRPRAVKTAAGSAPRFASIKDQIALFETLFVGGFAGEAFITEERGTPGVEGKKGYKEAGIKLARESLSAAAFASENTDELFKRARAVLGITNIAHPLEGPVPFGELAGDDRVKAIAGLKQLLHGEGAYADRVAAFSAALNLKDKDGKAKKVTWPLATVFGALFDPAQHTCVKPTAFAGQAATLGLTVDKSQALDAVGYGKFLEVAKKTQALLLEAGHQPRDLMDVYSFIWRTHAEKPATP